MSLKKNMGMIVSDSMSNKTYVLRYFTSLIRMIIQNITSAEDLLESADLVYSRSIPNRWKFLIIYALLS